MSDLFRTQPVRPLAEMPIRSALPPDTDVRAPDGEPASMMTVPLAGRPVTDTMLFTSPKDFNEKWYLPRYRPVVETGADGGQRFRIRLQERAAGWALVIDLEAYAAPELGQAVATAKVLPHSTFAVLRYELSGGTGIQKELGFELSATGGGVATATLPLATVPERDELYWALTHAEAKTALIVNRYFVVAVPVTSGEPVDWFTGGDDPAALRAPSATELKPTHLKAGDFLAEPISPVVVDEPGIQAGPIKGQVLYAEWEQALPDTASPSPFVFAPDLHGYIFGTIRPSDNAGSLVRHQLAWDGVHHSYYQESSRRNVFYYLPDTFKLSRVTGALRHPYLTVSFRSDDGSLSTTRATVSFVGAPYVDAERLEAAATALAQYTGGPAPTFEPLLADDERLRFRLALPGAGGGLAKVVEGAVINLRSTLAASVELSLTDFQAVFDALMGSGSGSILFTGEIEVAVGDPGKPAEKVAFTGRLDDLIGAPLSWQASPDQPSGGLQVTVTNAIESPVRIDSLPSELQRGDVLSPGVLQGVTLPIERLASRGTVSFLATPSTPLTGTGILEIDFDQDYVQALPDREAVWATICDPSTSHFVRKVTIKTPPGLFDPPAGAPDQQLVEVDVEIGVGANGLTQTVPLTAAQPVKEVLLSFPIADVVLGRPDAGSYRYQVTAVRKDKATTGQWQTKTGELLWIVSNDVRPA